MPISIDQLRVSATDTSNTLLLERITSLEARLAALESIITTPPGGGVAIVSPSTLKISAGSHCVISIGGQLTVGVMKDATITVGQSCYLTAGDSTTLTTGSAKLVMKKSGDVDISGSKISAKSSGDMILKGSKVLQN